MALGSIKAHIVGPYSKGLAWILATLQHVPTKKQSDFEKVLEGSGDLVSKGFYEGSYDI